MTALLLLLLGPALAQEEPCVATAGDVGAATARAYEAFAAMDVTEFARHRTAASRALDCLREPLTPSEAAAWHRLLALAAFLNRDTETATARFAASRVADPEARLPLSIAPDGHPLDKLFRGADPDLVGAIEPLSLPEGGRAWVDGSEGGVRPLDRPAVLQLANPEGAVVDTRDLVLGARAPDWSGYRFAPEQASEPAPEPESPRPTTAVRSGPHVGLSLAAGVAAVASGAAYGAAATSRSRFDDPGTDFDSLEGLRGRTNGLLVVSGIGAGAALGLGIAAFTIDF